MQNMINRQYCVKIKLYINVHINVYCIMYILAFSCSVYTLIYLPPPWHCRNDGLKCWRFYQPTMKSENKSHGKCPAKVHLPYSERLESSQITTLADRRIRGYLIEVYKIVNGLVEYGRDIFNLSRSGDITYSHNIYRNIRMLSNNFYQNVLTNHFNS